MFLKFLSILITVMYFKDRNWISKTVNCISCSVVCKIVFCSEFSSIPDKASKVTSRRRRRRTQVTAKRFTFQANAINNTQIDNDKDIDLVISQWQYGDDLVAGSISDVTGVWEMACYSFWRGWCGWRACVGGMLAWVTWVACLHGWRASVGGMGEVLIWVACYYYCYRYYWNTTMKKKMLSVNSY